MADGYFYTLSAIAQSFAAIIALNAIFVIYKLQVLKNQRTDAAMRLRKVRRREMAHDSGYKEDYIAVDRQLDRQSDKDLEQWAAKHSGRGDIVSEKEKILSEIKENRNFVKTIIRWLTITLLLNGVTILTSLVALPWRDSMSVGVQKASVVCILILAGVSLVFTIYAIWFTVGKPRV